MGIETLRKHFESYLQRVAEGVRKRAGEGSRYPCPCCGYPTLPNRGEYDICELCNWEDDGQDDPHADEVWGGPNRDYSLGEARLNFKDHLVMYRPGDDTRIGGGDSETELQAKKALMTCFMRIYQEHNETRLAGLWDEVKKHEATLDAELNSKIAEYEKKHGSPNK